MDLNKLIEKIKKIGGRITKTRRSVLEYLLDSDKPLSAADIFRRVKAVQPSLNRTTIYRELTFLTDNQLAREVKFIGKPSLFELWRGHSHHLVCLKCRQVKTIAMDEHLHEQEEQIMKEEDFQIFDHALEFYGVCGQCR